jgi:hypothetical protein
MLTQIAVVAAVAVVGVAGAPVAGGIAQTNLAALRCLLLLELLLELRAVLLPAVAVVVVIFALLFSGEAVPATPAFLTRLWRHW